jgi:hypothetical protein
MTAQEAGIVLKVHPNTVHRLVRNGHLTASHVPKGRQQHHVIIDEASVKAFKVTPKRTPSQIATEMWRKRREIAHSPMSPAPSMSRAEDDRLMSDDAAESLAIRRRVLAGQAKKGDVETLQQNRVTLWYNRGRNLIGDVRQSVVAHLVGA